ncbi:hypothetical protein DA075_28880 [Methylobacterium currus]|uniref:DUF1640 domain-containing protein n=1 Tax=Methylobacterium currus TaxID=2051553 RepID=A0A2R4WS69_9HYPH|nr:hypothetical protein DA075_28880 [Methylobacterium currus]
MRIAGVEPPTLTAIAFETYALVRRPKASGFSEDQAEAITGAPRDGRESELASLATKADLRKTEIRLEAKPTDLSQKVAALSHRTDLGLAAGRADLKLLEQRMIVTLGTLAAAGIGILIAAIRYLPPAGH